MALFVWRLSPTFGESNELIAHVDEGHLRAPPPKREFEQAAIERKRLFDVPDLQGHVVHADEPCFATQILYHFHDITSGIGANVKWSAGRRPCSIRQATVLLIRLYAGQKFRQMAAGVRKYGPWNATIARAHQAGARLLKRRLPRCIGRHR